MAGSVDRMTSTSSLPLQGRVALVTGAGRNIGRAIALRLARDGAAVAVNGRADRQAVDAVVAEIEAAGGRAVAAMGDVSDPAVPPRLAEQVAGTLGAVDILVSNAGLRRQTSFLDMSFEEWREIMAVALDGAFLLGKAFIPQMVNKGQGGAFVALSGISTHVGTPNRCHVSASKSGLEGLMRALAVELAPYRITCNAVAPGAIDTARGASAGPAPVNRVNRPIPLKRFGTVDEIAAMVRLLVGPEGTFITGQTVHVNGGEFLT
ncbi:MAG: SDR family NAD(P)-dependent oxidoreductase [Pseudomonadota bacterium]